MQHIAVEQMKKDNTSLTTNSLAMHKAPTNLVNGV